MSKVEIERLLLHELRLLQKDITKRIADLEFTESEQYIQWYRDVYKPWYDASSVEMLDVSNIPFEYIFHICKEFKDVNLFEKHWLYLISNLPYRFLSRV